MIARYHKGQRYELAGAVPHLRRDGMVTALIQWRSNCPQCGASFIATTAAGSAHFQPNRRCPKHHRPGQRVKVQA